MISTYVKMIEMLMVKSGKHMRKLAILLRCVCFVMVFVILCQFVSYITYPSNSITECWDAFYKQDRNSIDTLIVGSSHAYSSFSPEIISESLGGKTFILASNSQNVTQSYYNVKEALKYQEPKRIILEAYSINKNDNWKSSDDKDWKKESNIDGMRDGMVKLQAVAHQYDMENWAYAYLKLGRCHKNWMDVNVMMDNYLRLADSMTDYTGYMPSASTMSVETIKKYEKMKYNEIYEFHISDTNIEHFRKLAALCREKNIELIVMMAPMYDRYIQSFDYSKKYETIKCLVEEENLQYIDFNMEYERIGLESGDFEDAYSTYHHLNAQGAEKVTRYAMERII